MPPQALCTSQAACSFQFALYPFHGVGTDALDAELPSLDDLVTFVDGYDRLIIIDHGDGTWTATGPTDQFTIVGDLFTITDANSIVVDANTFIVSSDPVT